MAFDPNLPNDVKQSLRNNRTVPFQFGGAMMTDNAFAHNPVGAAAMVNGKPLAPSQVAPASVEPAPRTPIAAPTPDPKAVAAFNPSADFVRDDQTAQAAEMGMHRLPAGVVRSSIPGVYLARGKDGSFMASNVVGADGQPDFGGTSQAGQRMGLRARNANPGGTQVDPRTQVTDMGGWVQGPGAQGGTFDPNAGVVDVSGAGSLPGAAAGPRAGFTYAENGLHRNASDMIRTQSTPQDSEEDLQLATQQMFADRDNPEKYAADKATVAQLQGAVHDMRERFYGNGGGLYGMAAGAGGAAGGVRGGNLGLKDIIAIRQRGAALAQRAAYEGQRTAEQSRHNQATEAAAAQNANRQSLQQLQSSLATATDPNAAAQTLFSHVPSDPKALAKWVNTPEGQFVTSQIDQSIANAAGGAQTGAGIGSLNFDPNDPYNFQIEAPNAPLPYTENARIPLSHMFPGFMVPTYTSSGDSRFLTRSRFPNYWYSQDAIGKLKALRSLRDR